MSGKVRAEVEREGGEQIRRGKREGKEEKMKKKGRKKCKKKGITFRSISIYSGSTVSN